MIILAAAGPISLNYFTLLVPSIPLGFQGVWKGERDLMGYDVTFKIGRFLIQTPLDSEPGLRTKPRYEVPDGLRVEIGIKNSMINIGLVRLSNLTVAQSWSWSIQIALIYIDKLNRRNLRKC